MELQQRVERFENTVKKFIKRDGVDKVLEYLKHNDFYTAPASTIYHHSYEGGLVEHSLEVFQYLESDMKLHPEYSMETIAIIALFHDICKVNTYKVEMRNRQNDKGKWEKYPYYVSEDTLPLGHGEKSVLLLREVMDLTIEEMMAIRWHMGAYVGSQDWNTLGQAYGQFPLAMYLHFADMKSTYLK